MGLRDFFSRKSRKSEEEDALQMLKGLAEISAMMTANGLDVDELPNGQGPFGLSANNPVPIAGIPSSPAYLGRLRTLDGQPVEAERIGSVASDESITLGTVDAYAITGGGQKTTIYLCPYHKRTSRKAPKGFKMGE